MARRSWRRAGMPPPRRSAPTPAASCCSCFRPSSTWSSWPASPRPRSCSGTPAAAGSSPCSRRWWARASRPESCCRASRATRAEARTQSGLTPAHILAPWSPDPPPVPEHELTVALTGPTGDIGRSLVRRLDRDPQIGHIVAMARRPFDPAAAGLTRTEYRRGDVLDRVAVEELVAGADVVVHLAFLIVGGHEET